MKKDRIDSNIKTLSNVFHDILLCDLHTGEARWEKQTYGRFFFFKKKEKMNFPDDFDSWIDAFIAKEDRDHIKLFVRGVIDDVTQGIYGLSHSVEFQSELPDGSKSDFIVVAWGEEPQYIVCCCRKLDQAVSMDKPAYRSRRDKQKIEDLCRITNTCMLEWDVREEHLNIHGNYDQYELSKHLNYYFWDSISVAMDCMYHEDIPILRSMITSFRNGTNQIREMVRMQMKDGSYRWTQIHIEVHYDSQGNKETVLGVLTDVDRQMKCMEINGYVPETGKAEKDNGIYIRTFGYFEVFLNGKPLYFRHEKSKELLALLVDRRGGFVSSREAISVLWENEEVNNVTQARHRKVAMRLHRMLEEYGIGDIVEVVDHKRRLNTDKVSCDLFDYLSNKPQYANLFKGTYLLNYSWGEMTTAELTRKKWNI